MKGDFTRNTFDASKHFTRVLMQQGRVQLDADWNEQAAILLHYLQALAEDLIGPFGGPVDNWGFELITSETRIDQLEDPNNSRNAELKNLLNENGFLIGVGRYYVDGILCENEDYLGYTQQPGYPFLDSLTLDDLKKQQASDSFLAYLDVWERHITNIEDDSIREVALRGPDTATRAKVVWQVKVVKLKSPSPSPTDEIKSLKDKLSKARKARDAEAIEDLTEKIAALQTPGAPAATIQIAEMPELSSAALRARAFVAQPSTDPCAIQPDARYRGAENQLYRVEIHRGGGAWDKSDGAKASAATFKWSRENGSVVFPIRKPEGKVVTLKHLGRDARFGLAVGDWVEIVDDDYALQNRAEPLLKVQAIDPVNLQVTLDHSPASTVGQDPGKHPLLRRWDHKAGELTLDGGGALIVEGKGDTEGWLTLEDGVQIQFQIPAAGAAQSQYRTGDYWLIPARTATGDVEWPGPPENPDAVPPQGVTHHYAPLAIISLNPATGKVNPPTDLRRKFDPYAK